MNENNISKFTITGDSGFRMRFANGFTASVQFGPYCNCNEHTAEVACISNKRNLLIYLSDFNKDIEDTVIGYLNTNEVLDFMNWVANLPLDYVDKHML